MAEGDERMTDYTLYGHPRSGNAYKTALTLALTGTAYDFVLVDIADGGNLEAEYLKVNPLGKVPALRHGDLLLRQSHDTMRYLVEQTGQFGPDGWDEEARIGDWVGFAVDFFGYGLARLRFELLFGDGPGPVFDYFKKTADRGLGIIEPHLAGKNWLVGGRPTIADIACYPGGRRLRCGRFPRAGRLAGKIQGAARLRHPARIDAVGQLAARGLNISSRYIQMSGVLRVS
jgi:glutathione S-transferase